MIWMFIIMGLPVLGAALFFVLPLVAALPSYLVLLAITAMYHHMMMGALSLPSQAGPEEMIGAIASVRNWEGDRGQVLWGSEIWQARTQDGSTLANEEKVVIEARSGLILKVTSARNRERKKSVLLGQPSQANRHGEGLFHGRLLRSGSVPIPRPYSTSGKELERCGRN